MVDPNSLHFIDLEKNLQVQVYNSVMPEMLVTYQHVLSVLFTYPFTHTLKTSTINCLLITYTLSLCRKQISAPLIKNVFRNSNITLGINASHPIKNKGTSPTLVGFSSSTISFQLSIRSTCLSLFCFIYVPLNRLRFGINFFFSISVALHKIAHLLFATTFASRYCISITLCCAYAILCTFVACYTFNCTFADKCSSFTITFFSLASFCIICASTKCCSLASFSSDSLMHIGSIDVALGLVYSLTCRCRMLLHKNSITNVPIVYVS